MNINRILSEDIKRFLDNLNDVREDNIPTLNKEICSKVIKSLDSMKQDFKFIVRNTIINKEDMFLTMNSNCIWESDKDGHIIIKNEINDYYFITEIYGVSY